MSLRSVNDHRVRQMASKPERAARVRRCVVSRVSRQRALILKRFLDQRFWFGRTPARLSASSEETTSA
ncbi:hypothetical protein EV128_101144 [Rhizobium azibense]|nr:hypothetical protein EV128_101144 [Rhizobium azibense]